VWPASGADYQICMSTYSILTVMNDVLCANLDKDVQIPVTASKQECRPDVPSTTLQSAVRLHGNDMG
jgi:hypothetical protein